MPECVHLNLQRFVLHFNMHVQGWPSFLSLLLIVLMGSPVLNGGDILLKPCILPTSVLYKRVERGSQLC